MTKAELIKTIHASRAEFEALLTGMSPEQMTTPGVMGDWSIKDLLGHIGMWESRVVTIMYAAEQDAAIKMIREDQVDQVNAESVAEQRERPLERVLSDFHAVHAQLLKRVDKLPARDLADPQRFPWLGGLSLEEIVGNNTFGHYAEHAPAIEAWRARMK